MAERFKTEKSVDGMPRKCLATIDPKFLDDLLEGILIKCPHCGSSLEIKAITLKCGTEINREGNWCKDE